MKKLIITILCGLSVTMASAQFNYANQWNISAGGSITSSSGWAATLGAQRVFNLSSSSLLFDIEYINSPVNIGQHTYRLQNYLFELSYGYSFDNFLNSTWFHLNIVGGIALGAEVIPIVSSNYLITNYSGFRYGLVAKISPEFKITKGLSIFIEPKYLFIINSSNQHQFLATGGIKFYLR